jgi:hypothetical protein
LSRFVISVFAVGPTPRTCPRGQAEVDANAILFDAQELQIELAINVAREWSNRPVPKHCAVDVEIVERPKRTMEITRESSRELLSGVGLVQNRDQPTQHRSLHLGQFNSEHGVSPNEST